MAQQTTARLERRPEGGISYVLELLCPNACYSAGPATPAGHAPGDPATALLDVAVAYATGSMCAQVVTTVRFAGEIGEAGVTAVLFRVTDQRSGRLSEVRASL